MAVTGQIYPAALENIARGNLLLLTDDIEIALLANTYAFDPLHDAWDDVSSNQVTGGGTTPSTNLTTRSVSTTQSSAVTARANSTSYALGDIRRPAVDNGHVYLCTTAGTSGSSSPSWSTAKLSQTADGTVVWTEFGRAYFSFTSAQQTWSNSTATARFAVIWKNSGTPATSYLVSLIDFGQDESSSNGNFTVTPPDSGWLSIGLGSS